MAVAIVTAAAFSSFAVAGQGVGVAAESRAAAAVGAATRGPAGSGADTRTAADVGNATGAVTPTLTGAVAAALLPYATLEVPDSVSWLNGDFPPHALGAVGLRVYDGQPLHNKRRHSELSIDFPWSRGAQIRYRWKVMIPASVVSDAPRNRWWIITQWHDQPDLTLGESWKSFPSRSPPISISFGEIKGQSKLSVNYGVPDPGYKAPLLNIARDTWYSMDLLIHWSTGADGSAELRMDGALVWSAAGPNMHNNYQHYWKLGQYRNLAIAGDSTLWFDAIDAQIIPARRK